MSVSVSIVPILLFNSIGILSELLASQKINSLLLDKNQPNTYDYTQGLYKQEFTTNLTDRDTLIKTLKEHDCVIEKEMLGYIKCKIDKLSLEFYKENNSFDTPYKLKIECLEECDIENFLNDLSSEYSLNAQPIALFTKNSSLPKLFIIICSNNSVSVLSFNPS